VSHLRAVRLPREILSTARSALVAAMAALAAWLPIPTADAVPLTPEELAKVCAQADDAAHCGRLVEEVQLPRLPNLAVRDKLDLRVSLYPSGIATFTDVETLHGGRSYSLWDFMSEINAVVLYVTDGDDASFTLLQRSNGRKVDLPSDPKLSPDRQRLVTADFCERRCVNELALWRVTRDGVRKELSWRPREAWTDAVATWKDAQTIVIDYALGGTDKRATHTRKLVDADWVRAPPQ
jgi:hypothetical protein